MTTAAEYQATETEAQLLDWVITRARLAGWLVAHFRPAKTSKGWRTPVSGDGEGFPDLVLARDGKVILAELKSAKGKTSAAQDVWRFESGAYLWRPADRDAIEEVLR